MLMLRKDSDLSERRPKVSALYIFWNVSFKISCVFSFHKSDNYVIVITEISKPGKKYSKDVYPPDIIKDISKTRIQH